MTLTWSCHPTASSLTRHPSVLAQRRSPEPWAFAGQEATEWGFFSLATAKEAANTLRSPGTTWPGWSSHGPLGSARWSYALFQLWLCSEGLKPVCTRSQGTCCHAGARAPAPSPALHTQSVSGGLGHSPGTCIFNKVPGNWGQIFLSLIIYCGPDFKLSLLVLLSEKRYRAWCRGEAHFGAILCTTH